MGYDEALWAAADRYMSEGCGPTATVKMWVQRPYPTTAESKVDCGWGELQVEVCVEDGDISYAIVLEGDAPLGVDLALTADDTYEAVQRAAEANARDAEERRSHRRGRGWLR